MWTKGEISYEKTKKRQVIQERGQQIKLVVESKKTSKFLSKVNKLLYKGNSACIIIGQEKESYRFILKGKATDFKSKIEDICKDDNCDIKVEFRKNKKIIICVDDLNKINSKIINKLTLVENSDKEETRTVEVLDEKETKPVEALDEEEVKLVEISDKKETKPAKTSDKEKTEPLKASDEKKTEIKSLNRKEIIEYCLSFKNFTIKQVMEHFKPINQKEKNIINNTILGFSGKKWFRADRGKYETVKNEEVQADSNKKEEDP